MFNCLPFKSYYHLFHCCRGNNSCKLEKKFSFNWSFFGDFISRDSFSCYPEKITLYLHYKDNQFSAHNIGEFGDFGVLFYEHISSSFQLYLLYLEFFFFDKINNLNKKNLPFLLENNKNCEHDRE